MPGRIAQRDRAENIISTAASIFDQVQNTKANHQKNVVALHKLFVQVVSLREKTSSGNTKLVGERQFERIFYSLLLRLLQSKKGTPGDNVMKFVAAFVKTINDKAGEDPIHEDDIDAEGVPYTPAARFTERLILNFLVGGFESKEKFVRYRTAQLSAELVFHLGEIDEDVYFKLREKLLERIQDKESITRAQASIALCKFYGIDDIEELEANKLLPLSGVLFDTLAHDSSWEVRRAIVSNLPLNTGTLDELLKRTRDIEHQVRKAVYIHLEKFLTTGDDDEDLEYGPAHPRILTISQRELIVKNGLGDRDPTVRACAAKLIERWVEVVDLTPGAQQNDTGAEDNRQTSRVLSLLRMFDLQQEKLVADVLIRLFESNPQILDGLTFGDAYWESPTPETAFLARVCVEFCQGRKDEARVESIVPVLTAFAFLLQENFNLLVDDVRKIDEEGFFDELDDEARSVEQDKRDEREFIVLEMLRVAVYLDYGDETGRRKMDSLIRDMLLHHLLPEDLVAPCVEVLSKLADERDLIRVVVLDVIQTLRDPGDDEDDIGDFDPNASMDSEAGFAPTPAKSKKAASKPPEEMTESEKARKHTIDMRCLLICESMLNRVMGTLENNAVLSGVVSDLVFPAVSSKNVDMRVRGYRCLGLVSLISKTLALRALAFLDQPMKNEHAPEELRLVAAQSVFDVLMKYDQAIMVAPYAPDVFIGEFKTLLENDDLSPKVRALFCEGLAKLAISGIMVDNDIMRLLLAHYFSPKNAENQKLRQCLSLFFQTYSASSMANQSRIGSFFIQTFRDSCEIRMNKDDNEEMASTAQVADLFLQWTAWDHLFTMKGKDKEPDDHDVQFKMAEEIIRELLNKDSDLLKDDRKALCQLLPKLYLLAKTDEDLVRRMKVLMSKLQTCRPFSDAPSRNSFKKFDSSFTKRFEKQLEGFSEEEFLQLESQRELFDFLNDIIPPEEDDTPVVKRGRKRRSGSIASSAAEAAPTKKKPARNSRAKRARLSTSDDDETEPSEDGTENGTASARSSVVPTRTMPKRSATKKPPVIVISDDDDEEEEEEEEATPRNQRSRPSAIKVEQEADEEDEDEEQVSNLNVGQDDGDSEEEEEVSGLLAED